MELLVSVTLLVPFLAVLLLSTGTETDEQAWERRMAAENARYHEDAIRTLESMLATTRRQARRRELESELRRHQQRLERCNALLGR
jgi:hypothetical protein